MKRKSLKGRPKPSQKHEGTEVPYRASKFMIVIGSDNASTYGGHVFITAATADAAEELLRTVQFGNPEPLRVITFGAASAGQLREFKRVMKHAHLHGGWYSVETEIMRAIDVLEGNVVFEADRAIGRSSLRSILERARGQQVRAAA